jgi:hypothetical protein
VSRTEDMYGLNGRGKALVAGYVARGSYAELHMVWEEPWSLDRYLVNGHTYEEAEQDCPWSSGPKHLLALKENGEWVPESLWTDEEIAEIES